MSSRNRLIRVVLADQQTMLVDGLASILQAHPEINLVGRAATMDEALALAISHRPDVLVCDLALASGVEFTLLKAVSSRAAGTAVVLLSQKIDEYQMAQAVRLGVRGIVLTEMPANLLLECIRKVAAGEDWLEKRTAARTLKRLLRPQTSGNQNRGLSRREQEIVGLVSRGMRNKDIANSLSISAATVKVHLSSIFQKLGVAGRLEVALYGRETNANE